VGKIILYALLAAYFVGFGLLATVRPEKVRNFYMRQYASVLGGMKKPGEPAGWERLVPRASVFRFFGLASLLASVLIIYFLFRG
jgi:hypothetical protein